MDASADDTRKVTYLLAILLLGLTALLVSVWLARRAYKPALQALSEHVERLSIRDYGIVLAVSVQYMGRNVTLHPSLGYGSALHELSIELPVALPIELSIERETTGRQDNSEAFRERHRRHTGDRAFDSEFRIYSKKRAQVGTLLERPDMPTLLRELFRPGVSRVTFAKGQLVVTLASTEISALAAPAPLLRHLRSAFEFCDSLAPVTVNVASIPAEQRQLGVSCPYCRDPVADHGSNAIACEKCGTVHHRECWVSHLGCSVFGCDSVATRTEADPVENQNPGDA